MLCALHFYETDELYKADTDNSIHANRKKNRPEHQTQNTIKPRQVHLLYFTCRKSFAKHNIQNVSQYFYTVTRKADNFAETRLMLQVDLHEIVIDHVR